jgi:hypothetical protein
MRGAGCATVEVEGVTVTLACGGVAGVAGVAAVAGVAGVAGVAAVAGVAGVAAVAGVAGVAGVAAAGVAGITAPPEPEVTLPPVPEVTELCAKAGREVRVAAATAARAACFNIVCSLVSLTTRLQCFPERRRDGAC